MKYPLTILFVLLVGLQTFSKMLVILEYEWNKDYIIKTLCVNRSKPKSCCQGKCFLNKKLTQEENPQSCPVDEAQKYFSELQVLVNTQSYSPALGTVLIHCNTGYYLAGKSQDYTVSFFHPPQA